MIPERMAVTIPGTNHSVTRRRTNEKGENAIVFLATSFRTSEKGNSTVVEVAELKTVPTVKERLLMLMDIKRKAGADQLHIRA